MLLSFQQSVSAFAGKYGLELIIAGSALTLVLILVICWTILRKRIHADGGREAAGVLPEISAVHHPTKDEILDCLVEYDVYPTFAKIMVEVLNHFSMEYLNSYGELGVSFSRLVDFPRGGKGISPTQRAAMITIVRVLVTSDFIRNKCGDTLDENFDQFMREVDIAG